MSIYVTIDKRRGKTLLVVKYRRKTGEEEKVYDLTAAGCRQAGADLHEAGAESWAHSSATDFPQEYKPTFRGDVRDYMGEGFRAAEEKAEAPKKATIAKMLAWCGSDEFQATLTAEEEKVFGAFVANQQKGG